MIHVWVSPRYVNDLGWRGKLEWFGCTTSVVVLSFVIANAIPFFEELTSLVGGLLVPSLNLIFPILFYGERARRRGQARVGEFTHEQQLTPPLPSLQ